MVKEEQNAMGTLRRIGPTLPVVRIFRKETGARVFKDG
jgi:hypothetical protein